MPLLKEHRLEIIDKLLPLSDEQVLAEIKAQTKDNINLEHIQELLQDSPKSDRPELIRYLVRKLGLSSEIPGVPHGPS